MTIQPPVESLQCRFLKLLETHQKIIFKVAHAYCRHAEDRRDLAQEISVQLWRAFPRYDPARAFSTWLYRIALNVAISFNRRGRHRRTQSLPAESSLIDPSTSTPDEDERLTALQRFIDRLDDLNRGLMLLYLEERCYREIAEVLGITETNVATKISRLKQRILKDFAKTE